MQSEWDKPENNDSSNSTQGLEPVKSSDKRVINGTSDINQLAPFKYPWAWNYFLNANKNHWSPTDADLQQDISDYNSKLTESEKLLVLNIISYLTTSDIQAMRNIGLAVMEKMTAPELQIYQARQMYESSLHTWAYQHLIEQIGIGSDIYNRYRIIPEIHRKVEFANIQLSPVMQPDLDLNEPQALNQFMVSYAFFTGVFQGCWVYNAFIPLFVLQNRGLMTGLGKLCQYIHRDLTMHINFSTQVLRSIQEEVGFQWDNQQLQQLWQQAEMLEKDYIQRLLENPVDGLDVEAYMQQFRLIANQRSASIGMQKPFTQNTENYVWLSEKSRIGRDDEDEQSHQQISNTGSLSWD